MQRAWREQGRGSGGWQRSGGTCLGEQDITSVCMPCSHDENAAAAVRQAEGGAADDTLCPAGVAERFKSLADKVYCRRAAAGLSIQQRFHVLQKDPGHRAVARNGDVQQPEHMPHKACALQQRHRGEEDSGAHAVARDMRDGAHAAPMQLWDLALHATARCARGTIERTHAPGRASAGHVNARWLRRCRGGYWMWNRRAMGAEQAMCAQGARTAP
jgi:hypothetical protein